MLNGPSLQETIDIDKEIRCSELDILSSSESLGKQQAMTESPKKC